MNRKKKIWIRKLPLGIILSEDFAVQFLRKITSLFKRSTNQYELNISRFFFLIKNNGDDNSKGLKSLPTLWNVRSSSDSFTNLETTNLRKKNCETDFDYIFLCTVNVNNNIQFRIFVVSFIKPSHEQINGPEWGQACWKNSYIFWAFFQLHFLLLVI